MNKKKGFTLIELLVVIVIIGLLSGIAIVSYNSIFNTAEQRYYDTLESNILLAGNDYFEDHRNLLPTGANVESVSLNVLINSKYIEPVKDVNENLCTDGKVFAYRENDKYKYEVCINCGSYVSQGRFCNSVKLKEIKVKGTTREKGYNYDVEQSYNMQEYSKGEDIIVETSMDEEYPVTKYVAYHTSNNSMKPECMVEEGNKCNLEITTTGTYKIIAYNGEEEISNKYINVKIARGKPSFTTDIKEKYPIEEKECNSNGSTKKVVINIKKEKNEEYKSVKYQIRRYSLDEEEILMEEREPRGLRIEEELKSGHYRIDITVINYSASENDEDISSYTGYFDVTYNVRLETEDGSLIGKHEVVKDQAYNFLGDGLPIKDNNGNIYRWYKGGNRIYSENLVVEDCTYVIIGKSDIPVSIEDFKNYCKKDVGEEGLYYTGNELTLTDNPPLNVRFIDNKGTIVNSYTVKAQLIGEGYAWEDGTLTDKLFSCKIVKAPNPMQFRDNQLWETDFSTSIQNHNFTAAENAVGDVTYSIPTDKNDGTIRGYFTIPSSSTANLRMKASTPVNSYSVIIRAHANGDESYKPIDKDITMNVALDVIPNTITVTTPQTWEPTFSTTSQNMTITEATNAKGAVNYSILSQPSGDYFLLSNKTLTMKANTPVGTYVVEINAKAEGTNDYAPGTAKITVNIKVSPQKCNKPTNLAIGLDGKVTWTPSSNCSDVTHQVKVGTDAYATATSGVNKKSSIISATGTRTVYVKAAPTTNANYIDSDEVSKSVTVYSVTLSKGTGISSISGTGKYISGETVTIGATVSNGYTWSKWTQTSGGAQVSTTQAYSGAISANWNYTANAKANSYVVTYEDNLFAAQTQSANGLTAIYDESGSYLTLNGTPTTTSFMILWNLERRNFSANDEYRITVKHISGTMTCSDSSTCTGSKGRPAFVLDLTKDGSNFSDRGTSPLSYKSVYLPTSGSDSGTLTVSSGRTTANGLKYWLWQKTASNTTFNNYKVQILISKVHSKSATYNATYGTLDTPSKTGYDFDGWYTSVTSGTNVTKDTTYTSTSNQTLYARYTSHKLNVQYNGGDSSATWCSTNADYTIDSNKFAVKSSSRNIQIIPYGQYINYSSGFNNYNNSSWICFAKTGFRGVPGNEWVLNGNSSKKYNHDTTSYTAEGIAGDAGCTLATEASCTARLDVNWTLPNPIAVTATQSWSTTFSASSQDESFTPATGGQGTVTYSIHSQKKGSTNVSSFSIPTSSTATLRMAASTDAGTYTVVIRATAAGNDNYNSGYQDITMTVTVGKRTVTITAPTVVSSALTYSGSAQNLLSTAGSCSTGGTMYWYSSNPTTSSTAPTFNTSSGWTTTAPTSSSYTGKNAGTYYIWYYCYVSDTTNNTGTDINVVKSVNKSIGRTSSSLSINPTSGTLTYGTNNTATITKTGDGTLGCTSSNTNVATCSISGTTLTITPKANTADGKTATITVTLGTGTNYNAATSVTYSATVNRASLTCPSSPADKTYTGLEQASGIVCPTGSTAGGTVKATNASSSYSQTCTANSGYKFSSTCSVGWKINVATPTVSLTAKEATYTGSGIAANAATVSPNAGGAITYTYYTNSGCTTGSTTTAPANAGQYYVKASVAAVANKTSAASSSCVSHKINKKAVTLTAGSTSRAWNNSALTNSTCTAGSNQLASGHTVTCTMTSGSTITTAGSVKNTISTYTIKNNGGTNVTSNYEVTTATGTLTINLATPTVSLTAREATYTGSGIAANTATVSPDAGGAITYTYYTNSGCTTGATTTAPANAGQYYVKASVAAVSNKTNAASSSCVSHKINKKAVTLTAGSSSRAWNNSALTNSSCTAGSNQLVSGHTVTCTMTSGSTITTAGSVKNTISTYTIKNSGGTNVTSNYAVTTATGTLTITVATPTISLTAKSATYTGSGIAANAATVSPNAGGAITYTYYTNNSCTTGATTTAPTNVGQYYVIASAAAVSNKTNAASSSCVSHKINKAATTMSISPTSGTLIYGTNATTTVTTNGDGTISCSSSNTSVATCSVSGKTVTIIPQANTADSKTATITVSQAAGANRNAATNVTYSATVNRKVLTCPSRPSDKTYSGSSQNSGITCPTGSTAGGNTSGTNIGEYTQTCTAGSGYKFSSTCSVKWYIKTTNSITLTCNSGINYTGSAQNLLSGTSASGGSVYISTSSLSGSNYSTTGGTALTSAQATGVGSHRVYAYTPGDSKYFAASSYKDCSIGCNRWEKSGSDWNYYETGEGSDADKCYAVQTGWRYVGTSLVNPASDSTKYWYYIYNGKMYKGWIKDTDNNWYYLINSNGSDAGIMKTGWFSYNNCWTYLEQYTTNSTYPQGAAYVNGTYTINGSSYSFSPAGYCYSGSGCSSSCNTSSSGGTSASGASYACTLAYSNNKLTITPNRNTSSNPVMKSTIDGVETRTKSNPSSGMHYGKVWWKNGQTATCQKKV